MRTAWVVAALLAIGCELMQPDATADINGAWNFDAVQSCATGAPCPQSHGWLVLTEHAGVLTGTAHITGEPGLAADTVLAAGYKNGASIGFTIAACSLDATVYNATGTFLRGNYRCGSIAGTWNAVRPETVS